MNYRRHLTLRNKNLLQRSPTCLLLEGSLACHTKPKQKLKNALDCIAK